MELRHGQKLPSKKKNIYIYTYIYLYTIYIYICSIYLYTSHIHVYAYLQPNSPFTWSLHLPVSRLDHATPRLISGSGRTGAESLRCWGCPKQGVEGFWVVVKELE